MRWYLSNNWDVYQEYDFFLMAKTLIKSYILLISNKFLSSYIAMYIKNKANTYKSRARFEG